MSHPPRKGTELLALVFCVGACLPAAAEPIITIETPMAPPGWALQERELLRANARACREFFHHFFDDRGYLECVTRWGADDGPDDASENLSDWPLLYALGAPEDILRLYNTAWEGHLRQYSQARTTDVELARDGMYYKEFPVMFDWLHNGEGLTPFNLQGLCDPADRRYQSRVKRYAGFYMNEDPGAPNYDPEHRVIKSLINGSRGPLLRKATALDWAGDPIAVQGRFRPRHGERNYREMLAHFRDYTDVVGDHPLNLLATTLALNAYMLTGAPKYKAWLLSYVDAWRERALANGGIVPTNVGLDGKIGGSAGGRWYGGVYGWGFTVTDPVTGRRIDRNLHHMGLVGFGNAFLLTGDEKYLEVWRKQLDAVNAQKKVVNGQALYPHMYGAEGWYAYTPRRYDAGAVELYFWSMRAVDRARLPRLGWLAYLEGEDPGYPERALCADFEELRRKVEILHRDATTPDTRLADDPLECTPATVESLIQLTLGGLHPGRRGAPLHCRVRYFDPLAHRPGLPQDVAALVEKLTSGETTLTLVNVNQSEARTVLVQAGAYAEHQFQSAALDGGDVSLDRPAVTVRLGPGAGGRIVLKMKRYARQPTLAAPWDRDPGAG